MTFECKYKIHALKYCVHLNITMWQVILLSLYLTNAGYAHPVSDGKPLTYEQNQHLMNWKEGDKQNVWELSGQFEGDIVLSPNQRNGILPDRHRWPNRTITYMFAPEFNEKQRQTVNDALKEYTSKTCIKLKVITEPIGDYVYVTNNDRGCYSYIGKIGGRQILNLSIPSCLHKGVIRHEFLHALGFYHQHSATERDKYVLIVYDNIEDGQAVNFEKYDTNRITNYGTKYDYGSLMHYSEYAFSKNGGQTIVPLKPNAVIGKAEGLSSIDIQKLHRMYNC